MAPNAQNHAPVDIVIITIREDENEAILKRIPNYKPVLLGQRTYAMGTIRNRNDTEYTVAIVRTLEKGPLSAQDTTRDAIEDLDPSWIVLVGIAGGIPDSDFTLGDVVVATRVHDFTTAAVYEDHPSEFGNQGGPMHKMVGDLVAFLPALLGHLAGWNTDTAINCPRPGVDLSKNHIYGDRRWREKVRASLDGHFAPNARREPVVVTREVATSGFLVKSTKLAKQWQRNARDLIAVEMELGGVYSAARRRDKEYPVLAIRGISDIVGFKRSPKWTPYACATAASFCLALLQNLPSHYIHKRTLTEGTATARAGETPVGFASNQYLTELDHLFAESRVADWYVPLAGSLESEKGTSESVSLDGYVDSWLKNRRGGRLAILGDYGTGKSWFCLRLAKRLADNYRNAQCDNPLPLLLTFKRFKPHMDLEELIRIHLFDEYGVELRNPVDLRRGLQSGRIFPILDGLDEMVKVLEGRAALVAFSRLGLAFEVPRVLITCRTHYFYSGSEQREILSPDEGRSALAKVPKFDILHITMLDRPRMREYVRRRFDALKASDVLRFVESTYNLPELCSRPVLLSLVCESHDVLPTLAAASSSSDLYEAYIDAWLHRELRDGRLILEPDAVKTLFEDLAEGMVKDNTLVIDSVHLKQQLSAALDAAGLPPSMWKEVDRQLITSTFVVRSASDGWQFAHRSFQEFFYARKFFRWETETAGKGLFPVVHIPIWQFIAQMALQKWDEKKALLWIEPRVSREEDPSLTKTTLRAAAAYRLLKKAAARYRDLPLSGIMLDSVDLTDLDLRNRDLSHSDLTASDLGGTDLSLSNLYGSLLAGAQFGAANLQNTKLSHCDISYADFRGANFGQPRSGTWVKTLTELKGCRGRDSAMFDKEVQSFLS